MKFAICIPSNRGLCESSNSFNSAFKYSLNKNVTVSISDNSESIEKFNYYRNTNSEKIIYSARKNSGPNDNWLTSLTQVEADFKSILSDDDLIESTDINFELPNFIDSDIIGIRPTMSLATEALGIYNTTNYSITDDTAINRVKSFSYLNQSVTTTYFSFFRSNILSDIIYIQNKFHPTKGGYCDWPILFSIISSGKIISDPGTHITYNNTNWYGDEAFINNNIKKLFIDVDLPESSVIYLPLLSALDCFIMTMRSASPLQISEKKECATFLLMMYINIFLKTDAHIFSNEKNEIIFAIQKLSASQTVNECIINSIDVVSHIRDDLKSKYCEYYYQSTYSEVGTF